MSHYEVVLLVEQALSADDAARVRFLHEGIEEPLRYTVLIPVEDAAARIEAAMGSLSGAELGAASTFALSETDLAAVREESRRAADADLAASTAALTALGVEAAGRLVPESPIGALQAAVAELDAREVIVLTRPHVVAEFLHLDWTSQARRHLGVPVLHLLEHENFDEQAGGGEGISGA